MDARYDVLDDAARLAREFVDGLSSRPVHARVGVEELRSVLARPLTEDGEDPRAVIAELAREVDPGLVASAGPRYYGFVIGGALPVAVAADWLTSAWDQNAGTFVVAPALSVVEEVAANWVRELLGLPASCGVGFVTGCQMAHFTCLAAARHAVLRDVGWDVEAHGLQGSPELRVLAGEQAHVTVTVACRMLGLGAERVRLVPADDRPAGTSPPRTPRKLIYLAITKAETGNSACFTGRPRPPVVGRGRMSRFWRCFGR